VSTHYVRLAEQLPIANRELLTGRDFRVRCPDIVVTPWLLGLDGNWTPYGTEREWPRTLLFANLDHDRAHARTAGVFPVRVLNFFKPEGSLDRHGDFSGLEP
jgi:hypothetical protein